MKKIAIILAGSGVYDGSEIHEAVMSMYAIVKAGAEYGIFAPDIHQHHVINHLNGEEMKESRNVLIESARIARGNIQDLKNFDATQYDALIIPGGFGAAKNLCTFAFDGPDCEVHKGVEDAIKNMLSLHKPIGALCISPVILAKVIGDQVELTIGSDQATAEAIETMEGLHALKDHGEIAVDLKHKVVTTPCYMLDATIAQIADGAIHVVNKLIELSE
jgi:enhancing lycopene biosynthesis protein 2